MNREVSQADVSRACSVLRSRHSLTMQGQRSESMHAITGRVTRGLPLLTRNLQWGCALPAEQWEASHQPDR